MVHWNSSQSIVYNKPNEELGIGKAKAPHTPCPLSALPYPAMVGIGGEMVLILFFLSAAYSVILPYGVEIEDESDLIDLVDEGLLDARTAGNLLEMMEDPLDLSTASREEISMIPGISDEDAAAILSLRRAGGLKELNDLLNLEGFDERKISMISPFCKVSRLKPGIWMKLRGSGRNLLILTGGGAMGAGFGMRGDIGPDERKISGWYLTWRLGRVKIDVGAHRVRFGSGQLTGYPAGSSVEIDPDLTASRRRNMLALSVERHHLLASLFSFSSENGAQLGGAVVLPINDAVGLGALGYGGKRGCLGIWMGVGGKNRLEVEVGGNRNGMAFESRYSLSGKGGRVEVLGWRHGLSFDPDLGRIYQGERGIKIGISRRGRIKKVSMSGAGRLTVVRDKQTGGSRSYLRVYLSLRPFSNLSGGFSIYRYLRGNPSPDYASRSFRTWTSSEITRRMRLRVKLVIFRRLYASGPKSDGYVQPELIHRLPAHVEAGAGVKIERGGDWSWHAAIRSKGRLNGYLRLGGSTGLETVYLRVRGEI